MKPRSAIFLFFGIFCSTVFAHPRYEVSDSLKTLISPKLRNIQVSNDTATIRRLDKLAYEFFESFPDSTLYYGELEIQLAKKIKDKRGIADGYVQVAGVKALRGDYETSERFYTIALKTYSQLGYMHGLFSCYTGLGSIYDYLGEYNKAIQYYNRALGISLKSKNQDDLAECYNMLGITYDNKGEYAKALDNYFKSLFINLQQKNELGAADKYCNIGVIMHELELNHKALEYYKKARDIWLKLKDKQGITAIYQNIGEVLIDGDKYKEALPYLRYAETGFKNMGDQDGASLVYYDYGLYNLRTNQPDSAVYYFERSLQYANQSKIKYNKANAYLGLAKAFNIKKDFSKAYKYALLAKTTADTLSSGAIMAGAIKQLSTSLAGLGRFDEAYSQVLAYSDLLSRLKHNESIQKIGLYNLEVEFARKQKQVLDKQHQREEAFKNKLAVQRNLNVAYCAIIFVVATLAFIYYRGRRRQKDINLVLQEKNQAIILQQEDINRQSVKLNDLNLLKDRLIGVLAHDLRAPISTLRGLFSLMTDKSITHEEFVEMTPTVFNKLQHTSDFLDTLLFWINSQVDSGDNHIKAFKLIGLLEKELMYLDDKIKQKALTVAINIAEDITAFADPNSVRIVIHNFLTNAIKFSNRGGFIEVSAFTTDSRTIFCIKDNGVGMTEQYLATIFKSRVSSLQGTENESGTGMGLLFCKDLIEKYNGKVWVESKLDMGSSLCFDLPTRQQ